MPNQRLTAITRANASEPSLLTCCIIARNEAEMLPHCLSSLRGAADEVILVDTGSSDGTPDIARQFGATVLEQPWHDDFSAPRNLAAEHARGRYLLLLDADERLARGSQPLLRAALKEGDFDCGMLPLHNASEVAATEQQVLCGEKRLELPYALPRVFRNCDDLRWEGIIHERPTSWLQSYQRRFRTLADVPIVHYGAVPSVRDQRSKDARNLRLLEKHCREFPDDARIRTYLAYALGALGEEKRAAREVARAYATLLNLAQEQSGPLKPSIVSCAALHATYLRKAQLLDEGVAALQQALQASRSSQDESHPTLLFQLGVTLEQRALGCTEPSASQYLDAARTAFLACLAQANRVFATAVNPPGCVDVLAETRLGTIALIQGHGAVARGHFASVLERQPEHLEAQLGLLESLLAEQDVNRFQEYLAPLLAGDETASPPDALTLAACQEALSGQPIPAKALALQALRSAKQRPFIAPHRKELLLGLCRQLQAAS